MSFTPYTIDPNLDLVLEREVDVPPELVWKAWTTPELIKQWFAPKPFEMSLPAFTQHLGVLDRAGLVSSTKEGRVRTYRLAPAGLELADGWLADQRRLWEQRLDRLDKFVLQLKEQQ